MSAAKIIHKPCFRESVLPIILLIFVLVIAGIHIFLNVDFTINTDKYQAFTFARDLAHGRFYQQPPLIHLFRDVLPADKELPTGHIGTLYYNGKIFSKMEIGLPLILAGFYILFGMKSLFYVCQVFFLAFLLIYYFAIKEFFYPRKKAPYIALAAAVAVAALPNSILWVVGCQFRDIPALFLLFLSCYLLFRSLRTGDVFRPWMFSMSAFIFGISLTVRLSNGIFLPLFGIYFLLNLKQRLSYKKLAVWIVFAILFINIGVIPSYIQNLKTTGRLFIPPQHAEVTTVLDVGAEEEPVDPVFAYHTSLKYLIPKIPRIFQFFKQVYSIPGFILIGIGILTLFRSLRKSFIIIISPAIAIVFFGSYGNRFWDRYMLFLHPFLSPLLAVGVFAVVDIIRKLRRRRENSHLYGRIDILIAIALFAMILYMTIPPVISTQYGKQVYNIDTDFLHYEDIAAFRGVFEKHIPPGGILLASYRLYENIDFYTRIRSTDPYQSLLWKGTDFKFGLGRILDNGIPLFFIDNMGYVDGRKWVPQIKEHFDLTPVAILYAKDVHLRLKHFFGLKKRTLYKVERWSEKQKSLTLNTPAKVDYLLTINARQTYEDDRIHKAEVFLNGKIIGTSIRNEINYFKLPGFLIDSETSEFKISAHAPLPGDIFVRLEPVESCYTLDIRNDGNNEESLFITKGMTSRNSAFRRLKALDQKGSIRMPVIAAEGSFVGIKLTARIINLPQEIKQPIRINFSIDDDVFAAVQLEKGGNWQNLFAILPEEAGLQTAELCIEINEEDIKAIKEAEAEVEPMIEFYSMKVEQWSKHVEYAVPIERKRNLGYILSFEASGISGSGKGGATLPLAFSSDNYQAEFFDGMNWVQLTNEKQEASSTDLAASISMPNETMGVLRKAGYIQFGESLEVDIFSNDSPFVQGGLYAREAGADGKVICWTDGNALLNVPGVFDAGMEIEIDVVSVPSVLDGLTAIVFFNERKIGEIRVPIGSEKRYRFQIPHELLKPVLTIAREMESGTDSVPLRIVKPGNNVLAITTPTWKPSDRLGTQDSRDLGIPLRRILIFQDKLD